MAVTQDDVVRSPQGAGQVVSYDASTATTNAFGGNTTAVRVYATTDCFIEIGVAPVAVVNTSTFLPAGQVEYFAAKPGERVAAVKLTTAGSLYARETD